MRPGQRRPNADGSALSDMASFEIYYGPTDPPCPGSAFLSVASPTTSPAPNLTVTGTLTGLTTGTLYYLAVTAVNTGGAESACSTVASAVARIDYAVSPTPTVDFGPVNIGSVADQTFTIENTGGGNVAGTLTASAPFSVISGGSFNLVGLGATTTATVRFTPVVAATATGDVTFTANGGSVSSRLTGTGVGGNPVPTLGSLSPAIATAGGPAFSLTANGSNFVAGSIVRWNGTARTTTVVSTTQLTATIAAADIATAGPALVTVHNPDLQVSNAQTFTITAAPSLTASITSPIEAATVGGTVTVGMSESNGTGTISWALRLDSSTTPIFSTSGTASTTSFNWDTSAVTPGAHTLTLTVQDGAGRTATATHTVTVQQAPPATIKVFITQPGADGATASGTVWFTIWLENASSAGTLTLSIDGVVVATTTTTSNGPISMPWNSAGAVGGTHMATVSMRDSVGNTGSANRTIVIPGGPPPLVASFTSPAEGAPVGGTVTVGMNEAGGTGTITWTVRLDGGATPIFTTSGADSTASFMWNTTTVADGPHTLTLTVQDGAGRTATATRNVTVQQPPPATIAVFITQPGADGATVSGTTWFTIWIKNAADGNKTYTISVDGAVVGTTDTTSNGPVSLPWTTDGTTNGTHWVTISVRDSASGNGQAVRGVTVAN